MSRLAIKKEALRDLAIRSKNQCAFPGCDHLVLNTDGVYVAELCHIEAASPGGQRYNPHQTDEDRRSVSNLLFLCHQHHKITDDELEYSVSMLQNMKRKHEALPEVVFNSELLLQRLNEVLNEQHVIRNILQNNPEKPFNTGSYKIVGPELQEAWTPEVGRFYNTSTGPNTWFKYMMRDGWLHVEQRLEDGAIAYYEVDEEGNVRNSRMPYPLSEYRIVIPESLVLNRSRISSSLGTHAIETTLKWSKGIVVEHFNGDILVGFNSHKGCSINQKSRIITILGET